MDEVYTFYQELQGQAFQTTLEDFWTAFQEWAKAPDDSVQQNLVIQKANLFVSRSNAVYTGLSDYQSTINTQISDDIDRINELGNTIFKLNLEIQKVESGNVETAMTLRDERDNALDELASYVDISYKENSDGIVKVSVEGVEFVDEARCYEMGKNRDEITGFVTPYWTHLSDIENGDYDNVFSREGIDEELIAKYGNAWTAEQVEQANNGGYTLQYISLPPETEFVMLISVSSAAGKATLKKEIIATEPYVDPSAEWITVSSEATFVCGFFFNQSIPSLSNVINITNLKVEKLADRDLFRLTDAFSVSRIPELAASGIYSDLSGSPYYFYMDATDPNNVKVVNEVCQLGIVHNEYGAMSVGNDFNIQGGEEYQHGTYNRAEGTIRIGVLICYADSQQLFVTPFNSTLYLNPETPGNSVSTENFKKDPVAIPW